MVIISPQETRANGWHAETERTVKVHHKNEPEDDVPDEPDYEPETSNASRLFHLKKPLNRARQMA